MKTCREYEMEIMDTAYGEGELTAACRMHLETCTACRAFQASMDVISLGEETVNPVDDWVINQAVETAAAAIDGRNQGERRIFLALSIGLIFLCFGLLAIGFGKALLTAYLGVYLGGPLLLPVVIWKRQRGDQHA